MLTVCVCVLNSTPRLAAKTDRCDLFLRSEELRKHERQGDSVTEREGGNREERAWKTPQTAPGKNL